MYMYYVHTYIIILLCCMYRPAKQTAIIDINNGYNLFGFEGLQIFLQSFVKCYNSIPSDEVKHTTGVIVICYIDVYIKLMGVILLCNRGLHTTKELWDYNSTLLQRCSCGKWTRYVVFCLTNSLR